MGSCNERIEIPVPIDQVWETIRDFHDASWAPGVIGSLEKVGDKAGDEVGAKRLLNGVFHETLLMIDPVAYTFSYSIDDGPGPVAREAVSDYVGVVKLTDMGESCEVEWSSSYHSDNEEEVADFCNPIYSALLNAMKDTLS